MNLGDRRIAAHAGKLRESRTTRIAHATTISTDDISSEIVVIVQR